MELSPRSMATVWMDYPMQIMVAVFDFPAKADAGPADHVPLLAVDFVR
jgi:hypothetical protein